MPARWFLCSNSARTESRLLATIDMITSTFSLIFIFLLTYAISEFPWLLMEYVNDDPENRQDVERLLHYGRLKQAVFLAIPWLRAGTAWLLGILLFVGAQKRSYGQIRVWFTISVIYIVIDLILFVPRTIYTQNGKLYVVVSIFGLIYTIYELWVGWSLLKELKALQEEEPDPEDPVTEDTEVVEAEPEEAEKY